MFRSIKDRDLLIIYPQLRGDVKDLSYEDLEKVVNFERVMGPSFTLLDKSGEPYCLCGIRHVQRGLGTAWFIGTSSIPQNKKDFNKDVGALCTALIQDLNLYRLQAEVMEDKPGWIKWAESFGFKREGVMKHYYPNGGNAVMMGMVINGQ